MGRPRGSAAFATPVAIAAAGVTWFTLFAWLGFTHDPVGYLMPTLLIGVAIVATGVVGRNLRGSRGLIVIAQVGVALGGIFVAASDSFIPDSEAMQAFADAYVGAVESAQNYRSPIPRDAASVHPLLIAGGAISLLYADILATTLRRVSLVGVPLLVIYLLPALMNGTPVPWWVFPGSAALYLVLLFLSEFHFVSRWGRSIDQITSPGSRRTGVGTSFDASAVAHHRQHAINIGVPAIVLASLLALMIPSWDVTGWGWGTGSGGGGDEITIQSPMTDLRRDLTRGEDVPVLTVQTDDPRPAYLRIAVLNRFSSNAWTSGNRNFPSDQTASGQQLSLVGTSPQVPRTSYFYEITATPTFDSTWLPTPFPVTEVTAEGVWKYDRDTMDFLAAEDELTTADLTYTAVGVDLEHDAETLASAPPGAGAVPAIFTRLPENLPDVVQDLSDEVTRSAPSQFEKAVALQQWFREDGGFEYSLETSSGSGTDELVTFLTEGNGGRVGYCEQFASAMAVMARAQGIPARVAVGFLRPERLVENSWEYSSWDLHAWPELYFPGSGWVRFEPTPSARAEGVPAYTTQELAAPEPDPSTSAGPSESSSTSSAPRTDGPALPDEPTVDSSSQDSSWRWVLIVGVVSVVTAGLLLIPRTIRSLRRRRRWQSPAGDHWPELGWAELHDTVVDLGRRWPTGLSPRETRDRLIGWFGPAQRQKTQRETRGWEGRTNSINPDAVAALDRIVVAVEESRYAAVPREVDLAAFRADVERCVTALHTGVSVNAQRRAMWWPVSALRRTRAVVAGRAAAENEEVLERSL